MFGFWKLHSNNWNAKQVVIRSCLKVSWFEKQKEMYNNVFTLAIFKLILSVALSWCHNQVICRLGNNLKINK